MKLHTTHPARRNGITAGAAAALLYVLASVVVPVPPGVTKSHTELTTWAADNAAGLRWQAWLVMLAIVPLGFLAGWIRQRMQGPEATAFLVGSTTYAGLLALGAILRLGMAQAAEQGMDTGVTGVFAAYAGPVLTMPIALAAAALVVASTRGHLPRWLGVISAVLAAEQLLESATIFGQSGFWAPGGTMNTWVGPTLFVVWLVAQGLAVKGSADRPHRPSETSEREQQS